MAEIEKEEVEFPACATLWHGGLHKVAAPYFLLFMYIVQLYKEDMTILHILGCRAIAVPSTKQIVEHTCVTIKNNNTNEVLSDSHK